MIDVRINIEGVCNFSLFKLDSGKRNIPEIMDAIQCERLYNNSELDFGKLIYK